MRGGAEYVCDGHTGNRHALRRRCSGATHRILGCLPLFSCGGTRVTHAQPMLQYRYRFAANLRQVLHEQDNSITLDLRVHLDQGDASHFVAIPDIGGGQWVTHDYTNLEVKGLSIDIAVALSVLTYLDRVDEPSSNVVGVTLCRPAVSSAIPASCASLRNFITNDPGSDLIDMAPCLSSPTLDPADDRGDLSGDDVTPVLAPLLHVQTAAASVNWFLDGVLVGSSNASGGVASFRFPTVSTEGVHSYAAQHGTGGPIAAPLYLTIQIDALFRDAFEEKTLFPLPLG